VNALSLPQLYLSLFQFPSVVKPLRFRGQFAALLDQALASHPLAVLPEEFRKIALDSGFVGVHDFS